MVSYSKDLETKGAKIEARVRDDFVLSDWQLNSMTKEWVHKKDDMRFKLEKNESTTSSLLKDKLVHYHVSS
jgi:hypothetical protein